MESSKLLVFLSHAGEDEALAIALAVRLEHAVAEHGPVIEVFNTSEPEHRFEDVSQMLRAGELWQPRVERWEEQLRTYLEDHLSRSEVYVLLVTPESLRKNSRWIAYEIETARQLAERERVLFLPCLAGRVAPQDLPESAQQFQGIEVTTDSGFDLLVRIICERLSGAAGPGTIRADSTT